MLQAVQGVFQAGAGRDWYYMPIQRLETRLEQKVFENVRLNFKAP